MAVVEFSQEDNFEELMNSISLLKERGEEIVTDTLHNEGADILINGIRKLIHPSNRKWKGKIASATKSKRSIVVNKRESGNLNVVVGNSKSYGYLYYPNDGSSTKRHRGEQHFIENGAKNNAGKVVDLCIKNLMKEINN